MTKTCSSTLRALHVFLVSLHWLPLLLFISLAHAEEWNLSSLPEPQFQWVDSKGEQTKKGFPARGEWVADAKTGHLPKLRVWIAIPKAFHFKNIQGEVSNVQKDVKDSDFSSSTYSAISFDTETTLTAVTVEYENKQNASQDAALVIKANPTEPVINRSEVCDRLGISFFKIPSAKPLAFLYMKLSCREDKENIEVTIQHSADIQTMETEAKGSVERGNHFARIKFAKSMLPKEPTKEEKPDPVKTSASATANTPGAKPDDKLKPDSKTTTATAPSPVAAPKTPATPPKAAPESMLLGKIRFLKKGTDLKAEFGMMYRLASEAGWHFSVSLGPSYLKYSESLANANLTQIGLTGKFSAIYNIRRSKFFFGGNFFATLLPLTHSPSSLDPTRFYGLNLDAGKKLGMSLFGADWRFTTGMYFWGMLVPGNSYGLKLLVGPKAVFSFRKGGHGKRMSMGYVKYSPVADTPTSLSVSNFEFALGYGHQLNSAAARKPILLTFDLATMNFRSKVITNTAKLLSGSAGLQINF